MSAYTEKPLTEVERELVRQGAIIARPKKNESPSDALKRVKQKHPGEIVFIPGSGNPLPIYEIGKIETLHMNLFTIILGLIGAVCLMCLGAYLAIQFTDITMSELVKRATTWLWQN